jgi:hypothetical protein
MWAYDTLVAFCRRRAGDAARRAPALVAACCLLLAVAPAIAGGPGEYRVKAALIYNFARFTQWPDTPAGDDARPLRLVVLGGAEVQREISVIAGQMVGKRPILVEALPADNNPHGADMLFVAETERDRWRMVQIALADKPILTIGEMNGFLETGGMINLAMVDKKVRFFLNLDQTKAAGLSLNSRILVLASRFEKDAK